MFAPIYICQTHGETWHVEHAESIDTDRDEIYEHIVCSRDGSEVKPLLHDGHQVVHPLTNEEIYWETYTEEDAF